MGKASRRKRRRRESERRSIHPMDHQPEFHPNVSSRSSIQGSYGAASTSAGVYVGPYGMIATACAVTALENWPEHGVPSVAHRRAEVKRSTVVRQHSGLSTKEAEVSVGAILAQAWTIVSGSEWMANSDYPQDSDIDLELSAAGHKTAYAQLTRAQPSDSWELKQGDSYQTSHTMDEAAEEVLRAIRQKQCKLPDRSGLVLVLDAYILALSEPVLRRIHTDHVAEIESSGFEEIWYVAIQPRTAVRLYPGFLAVDFRTASDGQASVS